MNRKLTLLVIWIGLLVSVPVLRSFRFEQDSAFAPLTLEILRTHNPILPQGASWIQESGKTVLRVEKPAGQMYLSFPLLIPNVMAARACHMVVSLHAEHLTVGKNSWDTGRIMMFWRDLSDQKFREFDTVAGVEKNEIVESFSQVMRPASGFAEPHLRIEHLGKTGLMTITQLDLIPVLERTTWVYLRFLVVALWIAGITLQLCWYWGGGILRNLAAASLWIFCASLVSFPGPWKNIRPCFIPFQIRHADQLVSGKAIESARADSQTQAPDQNTKIPETAIHTNTAIPLKPVRQISPEDAWMVSAKVALAKVRWLIHVLMLTLPCLVWSLLVERKATIALGLSFAVSMELAQVSLGFGFDGWDVVDLICNSAGLAIAILTITWLSRTRWLGPLCRRLMPASES